MTPSDTIHRPAAGSAEAARDGAFPRAELPVALTVFQGGEAVTYREPSFAQERLWLLDRLRPERAFHNVPAAWRLAGALDAGALERALGEVVRRHEVLRTTFAEVDGAPVQVIAPFGGFALPVEELSALDEDAREAEARRRAAAEAARPFDLSAGPLFRATLLRLAPETHVLLLCMHHVVSDGWSMGVLFRELSVLYTAFRGGGPSPLAPLPLQYADFAAWQRRQLAGNALDGPLAYWKERLAGAPTLLELPTDRPRPAVQSHAGATEPVELSAALMERLEALGRREGVTPYMVLLAAFQVLLSRYGGSEDVVVGSPVAGRTRVEVEGLIGPFVNTLVLRTQLDGDPAFREVLRRVRETTLGAREHQDLPFERLVDELHPRRVASHTPLFQVMFTLEDAHGPADGFAGLRAEVAAAEPPDSRFDLTLALAPHDGGMRGGLTYATDLFDAETIRRMGAHLARVLEQVADDADRPLSALELLDGAERELVLRTWNRTEAAYPSEQCIHALFEEQARRTPDAVAVVHEHAALTYAELDARANRIAHHLRGLGVGPEARVGVCLRRGVEMLASLLAVLKAGGAYVPLDPAYPAERLALTLRDSGAGVLVTEDSLRGLIPVPAELRVVSVDGDAARIGAGPADPVHGGATPRGLAYLIYTSGSTGVPKGVAIEHASAVALLSWAAGVYTAEELAGVLASTSICFDLSVYELFLPLATGGRVILVENALALPASAAANEVRLINTVPSAIAALLEGDEIPAGVRTVNLAGEPLAARLVDALYARGGIERVFDLYGPSEDTTYSTFTLRRAGGPATIGRPIANTRAYVLDAGRLLPAGVPGELYLAGQGLARGYLGRPALTAERWVPDPFAAEPGARMYRTGDRVRWRADGTLQYLGRLDAQVKVRGFRIELGEVEAALRRSEAVRDCVVVVREDAPGGRGLVAYVAGAVYAEHGVDAEHAGHAMDAEALRRPLRSCLPEYMVPAAFVVLDALPLTPNGKVDRRALPAPEREPESGSVAPRTPVEEVLARIWAETLGVERVGVHDDFFALGGHSLLAMRVVSRVREAFGVEPTVRTVFEAPTVARLAAWVHDARRAGLPPLAPVTPAARGPRLPLSFAQERLWFLDRLRPESAFYNVPAAWRLAGALDAGALERALGEVVRRHEVLRTTFAEVDGAPVQVIAPFGGFVLPVEDLSALDGDAREAEARRRAADEAARPFDLSAGPLFRARLLRLGDGDHLLLVSMHHAVSDEWSVAVLFRELSALYAAHRAGRPSPLAELPVQYADFAAWEHAQLRGERLERQMAYWRDRLAGAPAVLELPADRPRPPVQSHRGAVEEMSLSAELAGRLRALAHAEGATSYMVLLAAFQVLLARYAGSDDVVVGSPMAGRARREVEGLIGFFANTLVLRTDLSGDPAFREAVRRVRAVTLGAHEHPDVPFERLVEALRPDRGLAHSPLFQVMFVQRAADGPELGLEGLEVRGEEVRSGTSKFDLTLFVTAHPRGIDCTLEYATDLFEPATAARMLSHLRRLLEAVAEDAGCPVTALALMGDAERRLVVEEWNRTAAGPPRPCVQDLFAARAARTPHAPAVSMDDRSLTHGALDARAGALARRLAALGVGPDVRVGICLERGLEMIVAVVAVLRAGGACVPLDPRYPPERVAFMAADAAAPVLLTQQSLRAALPALAGVRVLCVDADEAAPAPPAGPLPAAAPENLAYVLYTSGSTGTPKGVMMPHAALSNLVAWHLDGGVEAGPRRTLQFASLSFDVAFQEIAVTLAAGGELVLVDDARRRDPDRLVRLLARRGVERIFVPFVALQALADAAAGAAVPLALRELVTAGEALVSTPPIAALVARTPGCRLLNHYGPTETHVATAHTLEADPAAWSPLPPIGRPVANTTAYVLDAALRPLPVGVPGELYVGGAQVARGYLGRPALTAARFVPDPFGAPGARLYATGDRARRRADGELEYLGRADQQVKIRGFRVEPGEVESALRGHHGVRDCAVVAREDAPGQRRLVAYVVGNPDVESLRAHLRRGLPEHMVPAAFVALDALPLTPSGKLDRRSLPAPSHALAQDRHVAPRTPVEEALARIWAETLGVERVGVHDGFFDLGGHSLLATRLVWRIREALDGDVDVVALFEAPTIDALAPRLSLRRPAPAGPEPLPPAPRSDLDHLSDEELDRLLAANPENGTFS